jgi:hypothetical protein
MVGTEYMSQRIRTAIKRGRRGGRVPRIQEHNDNPKIISLGRCWRLDIYIRAQVGSAAARK